MHDEYEVELRLALEEGLLSQEEVERVREEARREGRGPLRLLREQGRLSEETLALLMRQVWRTAGPSGPGPQEASTLGGASPMEPRQELPAFPITGWDRYECVRFLGQGGMGRVFLAYEPRLRRNVAIKFVREDRPELARRVLLEAQAQARVNHERVCKVFEVGEVSGKIYIAMQYVEGRPLSALADELTVEQKVLVLRGAAEGIHEAHRVGLIHRDLKPSNIMVERTEQGELKPYVMDFGLARDWKEEGLATDAVLGTPHYMAPEQARGEVSRLDRRADVYSLGATLYHLLTGRPPIPGSHGLEVLGNIATHRPRPLREWDRAIPADLEAIALKCLEKDSSARYDSARTLAEELDRFLGGEPVQARTGRWYWLRKKAQRHRYALAGASVALLLVGLAVGQAALARGEAEQRERLARQFTEKVETLEAMARYSALAPAHDTRRDRRILQEKMEELAAEVRQAGALAVGPGRYALGRGAFALGDWTAARVHLEAAWRAGFQEPRAAYALALVVGHLYQERLLEVERIQASALREERRRELARLYREPALDWLRRSQGATVPSPEYVLALLAFYEERLDDALAQLDAIDTLLPWFYEAPQLRGDILLTRASRHWNQGRREQALADFEASRQAYTRAAAIGESVPEVHQSLARLELMGLLMELYGQGEVPPYVTRGLEAVRQALAVAPGHYESKVLEASLQRRLAEYRVNQGGEVEELLSKAVAAARAAVALAPERSKARVELGQCFWQWAKYRQTRGQDPSEHLRQAVEAFEEIEPKERDYEYHATLGLLFKLLADREEQTGKDPLGNRGRTIQALLDAIALDERLPDAWINLGMAYFKRASHPRSQEPEGDLRRGLAALDQARALNPQHVVPYFYGGQLHQLAAQLLRDRGGDPRPELALGLELYRKGLAINPKLAQLHNGTGSLLLEQARDLWDRGGDPRPLLEQARAAYEQAIAVAPQQGFGYNNLGELHALHAGYLRGLGEDPGPSVRAADKAYRQAAERLSGQAFPWANLGAVHDTLAAFALEQGRDPRTSLESASEALRVALERNPLEAHAWVYLGETRGLSARWLARQGKARAEDFEQAAQAFQRALELAPRRLDYRVTFGRFCREWASWRQQTGAEPGPPLKQGLALAEQVLASRPEWSQAQRLRASLLTLTAR